MKLNFDTLKDLTPVALVMIVPWGLTPGASGTSEASPTRRFSNPHTRPKLSAPVRERSSPMRTLDVRWTVMRLVRFRVTASHHAASSC